VAFGKATNLLLEVPFLASFLTVLALNAERAHRAARLLMVVSANACVFVGALMFEKSAGGTLPFFALVALPLLLFGPKDRLMLAVGALLPALLFIVCEMQFMATWLGIQVRPPQPWHFAANVASAFIVAFVVPFFFYRSNLKAEVTLEKIGREQLKRVIDSNLIGVVRGRLSGGIEEANDTFLGMLGYTSQDLAKGALDLKAIAPLDPFDHGGTRALRELSPRGARVVYERTCHRKDGSSVPVLVGVALLDESHDEIVGFVLDLSAQKHLEAQKAMLQESREALRLRDLFDSIASHELKTPLTALLLSLRSLRRRLEQESLANGTLKAQVDRCESAAARMGDLIHTLLDMAQIHQNGKLKLSVSQVDLVDAVRRVVSGLEAVRAGGPQEIQVEADGPVTATLDSLRFDQVLTNLLSNAMKYGAGKPIEVRVRRDQDGDLAHLEVIDHGHGIDPGMTDKIFEPFERAVSAEGPIPGLGLGLYVVKMIVEGHGGRIHVESRPGLGSRFIVDLPCAGRAAA
jgi:PAS domain S-box-containing protein